MELFFLGRALEGEGRGVAARHDRGDLVEVAGTDLTLVLYGGVALGLAGELALLPQAFLEEVVEHLAFDGAMKTARCCCTALAAVVAQLRREWRLEPLTERALASAKALGQGRKRVIFSDLSRLVSRSVFTRFDSFLDESSSLVEFSKSGPFP